MSKCEITSNLDGNLGFRKILIEDIDKVDDYLFIVLNNKQNILTNGKDVYDVSEYNHLISLISMGNKFCGVFMKGLSISVVDLKTMEVLFEDDEAYSVSKQDDRCLHVIMKIGSGNNRIFDVESKKYLPMPNDYEFEHSLGNNLYVFREENNLDANFYDYKRCVINANGKTLLKDVEGWIYLNNNNLIVIKTDEIDVVKINEDTSLGMKTIRKTEKMLAKPSYYDGKIIVMVKDNILLYTPELELIKKVPIEGLEEVLDYEIVNNTLKLCLPKTIKEEKVNKHLFVNLETGKYISHIRIEGYPYWVPTTYVGQDSVDTEVTNYHFYNRDFKSIIDVKANSYEGVDTDKECMFMINTVENDEEKKQLLNAETGSIREVTYDFVKFPVNHSYGYGVDFETKKIDFFDENLKVIIPDFNYEKYDLSVYDFGYFIVNNYLCVINRFVDGYGISRYRTIIERSDGEKILDSVYHSCFALGNFIQIIDNKGSKFLNTLTGEIGKLSIEADTDEAGRIDLDRIINVNNILTIAGKSQGKALDVKGQKVKKIGS